MAKAKRKKVVKPVKKVVKKAVKAKAPVKKAAKKVVMKAVSRKPKCPAYGGYVVDSDLLQHICERLGIISLKLDALLIQSKDLPDEKEASTESVVSEAEAEAQVNGWSKEEAARAISRV